MSVSTKPNQPALPVLIAGAGIGGLFAALCLHRQGIESILLEQSSQLLEVGAGIQIGANGTRIIRQLGLESAIQNLAISPAKGSLGDGISGSKICSLPFNGSALHRYKHPYFNIHRADLQRVLVKAVQERIPGCLKLGCRVKAIEQDSQKVTVQLESGENYTGSILVGCDGIHSQIRKVAFGEGAPVFAGCVAWRAVVPLAELAPSQGKDQTNWNEPKVWVGPNKHIVQYPVSSGKAVNLVAVVDLPKNAGPDDFPESWQGASSTESLKIAFANWCPQVRDLVAGADKALCWGLYHRAIPKQWFTGRVVLLGDAAHAMLPSLAQGAAMAMEDAEELASRLVGIDFSDARTVSKSLESYQSARIDRCRRVQRSSAFNRDFFHLNHGISDRLALYFLKLLERCKLGRSVNRFAESEGSPDSETLAQKFLARRYHWLYGYKRGCVEAGAAAVDDNSSSI